MKVRNFAPLVLLSLFGAVAAGLVGCGSNSSLGPSAGTSSRVRLLNALVGGPTAGVDFYNSTKTLNAQNSSNTNIGVLYGTYQPATNTSTLALYRYVQATNSATYSVYANNAFTPGASIAPLATNQFSLDPHNISTSGTDTGGTYTLVTYGVDNATDVTAPRLTRFVDSPPNNIPTGQFALRVIHVAPNVGTGSNYAVSLYNEGTKTALIGNITYGNSSSYVSFQAGSYSMSIRDGNGATVLLGPTTYTFQQGLAYTLYLIGQAGNTAQPLQIIGSVDFPYDPNSRASAK